MIKESLSGLGLAPLAVVGLVLFVATFVGIAVWTMTRRAKQVATWSSLPLVDGMQPVEPRANHHDHDHHEDDHECRNCGNCQCKKNGETAVVSIQ
jgi:hypothetical protein